MFTVIDSKILEDFRFSFKSPKVLAIKISPRTLPAFVSSRATDISTTTLGKVYGLVNILFQYRTCRCQSKSISRGSGHLVLKLK